jgi:hypothetical protein
MIIDYDSNNDSNNDSNKYFNCLNCNNKISRRESDQLDDYYNLWEYASIIDSCSGGYVVICDKCYCQYAMCDNDKCSDNNICQIIGHHGFFHVNGYEFTLTNVDSMKIPFNETHDPQYSHCSSYKYSNTDYWIQDTQEDIDDPIYDLTFMNIYHVYPWPEFSNKYPIYKRYAPNVKLVYEACFKKLFKDIGFGFGFGNSEPGIDNFFDIFSIIYEYLEIDVRLTGPDGGFPVFAKCNKCNKQYTFTDK